VNTHPLRMVARIKDLPVNEARQLANEAVKIAFREAPKMSGTGAKGIRPTWGPGYYGVSWINNYMWFQERGIKAYTMNSLAGKTIPMWIDDVHGEESKKNPKAKTRVTKSGKKQVLIFRKVGRRGDKKRVKRNGRWSEVPNQNYPGGPGRIALRQAKSPFTSPGKLGGQIAPGNVGVRWRHPGLQPRHFLLHGVVKAAGDRGYVPDMVVAIGLDGSEQRVWPDRL
jgi:hypothetical protein